MANQMTPSSGSKSTLEALMRVRKFQRIGNRAVQRAQEENRRLGIPNAYLHNGKIFYELPDGTITQERPTESGNDR